MARIEIDLDDHQYETARRQADAAGMTLADFVQQAFDTRFPKSFDQTEALARLLRTASTTWGTPVGPVPTRVEPHAERPSQSETLARILARGFPPSRGGPLPTREELYAERINKLVRRHERPDLYAGSSGFGEAGQSVVVDDGARGPEIDRPEPTEPE